MHRFNIKAIAGINAGMDDFEILRIGHAESRLSVFQRAEQGAQNNAGRFELGQMADPWQG